MLFQDIKGQDKPVQILKKHIAESRLSQAYLFLGPEGVGKRLVASTLAGALNCQEQGIEPCGSCPSCLKIEKNQHPDVHIIDRSIAAIAETEAQDTFEAGEKPEGGKTDAIKIEDIRQLQKEINLKPYEGRKKVFIIDNAHKLTEEATGALLKTLEEPPGDSLIILITAKPALMFKTIISRCRLLKFLPLERSRLEGVLRDDYAQDAPVAHFLAYFCEGRLGYALRLKESDIFRHKNRVIDAFTSPGGFSAEGFSVKDRASLRFLLNILAAWFRDIYLIKTGSAHAELINLDRKQELLRVMNRYAFIDLDGIFDSLSAASLCLEQNINIKLLLSYLKAELWKN